MEMETMEETWSTKQKTEFFPNERQLAFGADQGERRGLLFTAACFEYECKGPRESDSQHEYSGGDEWSGGGPVDWWRRVLGSDAGMWPLAKNWNWKIINCRPAMRREQQSEFRAEIQSNARPVFRSSPSSPNRSDPIRSDPLQLGSVCLVLFWLNGSGNGT